MSTDGRMDGRTHYYSPLQLTSGKNFRTVFSILCKKMAVMQTATLLLTALKYITDKYIEQNIVVLNMKFRKCFKNF